MAVFNKYINNCSKLDWKILMWGSIALYSTELILQEDINILEGYRYRIVVVDCSKLKSMIDFHRLIKKSLEFPDYYGENIAALNDCLMSDLKIPDEGGFALVLKNFNLFYGKDERAGQEILECLDLASRRRLLTGEKFITLLHTSDKEIKLKNVGEHPISWSNKEFSVFGKI